MSQEKKLHIIVTSSESDVIGLKALIFDISDSMGLTIEPEGAFKSSMRKIHNEDYFINSGQKRVGKYGFKYKDGQYEGRLDLQKVPEPLYSRIMERVTLQFPQLFPEPARR